MRGAIVRLGLPAAVIMSVATPVCAATKDTQLWTTAGVSGRIAPDILGSIELTGRYTDDISRLGQMELRTQLGTPVSKTVTLWLGYVHIVVFAPSGLNGIENQTVQQVSWTIGKIGRTTLSSRTRLEQRFQRGVGTAAWRTREQLRLVMPLHPGGPSAVVWVEPFVSLNRTSAVRAGIDQVRSFAGVSVPLAKGTDIEIGYLNQYLNRAGGDRSNNTLSVSLAYRF